MSFLYQRASSEWRAIRKSYSIIYNHYYNNGTSLTDIIPVVNQNQHITVRLSMALNSLNGFDAVAGHIDISGSIKLQWLDEITFATESAPSGISSILIDYDKAWTPSIVLVNAVDTIKNIGESTYKLDYNPQTGNVQWQPRILLRASCTPDVKYYPFDRQVCDFTYTAWGYSSEEIKLAVTSSEWDCSKAEDSGVWKIISTTSSTFQDDGSDFAKFEITIERHPLYFTFNIGLPILLLGVLNGFVFLLPAESGERIGFCVTCFLSFVVLMQTTMGFLPQIASPMSLLCIYVFLMMCCSVFINIVTILMLRIYHKPENDKVPKWIQMAVRIIGCKFCRSKDKEPEEMNWPSVGRLLDFFFFLVFVGAQIAMTLTFLIPIGTHYN